jgi:hypothetical protein
MVWPLLKSIANFILQIEEMGIYHADIFLRNIIKVPRFNRFKLIDFDKAFQFKETERGKQNYEITKYILRALIKMEE